jgi:hypothetical protein
VATSAGVVLAISPCTIWPTFCSSVMPARMAATWASMAASEVMAGESAGQSA